MKNKLLLLSMPIALLLSGCGMHSQTVKTNIKETAKYYYQYESFSIAITDNKAVGEAGKYNYDFDHGKFKITHLSNEIYYKLEKKDGSKSYFDSDEATRYYKIEDEWHAEVVTATDELNNFKQGAESLFKITSEYSLLSWKKEESGLYSTHASYGGYTVDMKLDFDERDLVKNFYVDGSSEDSAFSLSMLFSGYGETVVTLPEVEQ